MEKIFFLQCTNDRHTTRVSVTPKIMVTSVAAFFECVVRISAFKHHSSIRFSSEKVAY